MDKPSAYISRYKFETSLTDNGEYPEFCEQASQDDVLFKDFRRNPIYNFALEHDPPELGLEYFEIAKKLKHFTSHIEEFKRNETIGNPVTYNFGSIGEVAPTTMRYIKILSDLEHEFGSIDNFNIIEIGVGYGGLCRIINSYFKSISSYCLVDLGSVLKLTEKYLNHFDINASLTYKTAEALEPQSQYDLAISNYAFTELKREIQDVYIQKVILNSRRGYITYNSIDIPEFNSYRIDELIEIVPNMRVLREIDLTSPDDRILVWSE